MLRAALLLPLLLLGCSQRTELSARFRDGRVVFVSLRDIAVDCVEFLTVVDLDTDVVMWEIGGVHSDRCQAALPITYGQDAPAVTHSARPLVPGHRYEVAGRGPGGNGLDGLFTLVREDRWRLQDLVWDNSMVPAEALDAIANQPQ
jgi:hypothetical protein